METPVSLKAGSHVIARHERLRPDAPQGAPATVIRDFNAEPRKTFIKVRWDDGKPRVSDGEGTVHFKSVELPDAEQLLDRAIAALTQLRESLRHSRL